MTKKILFIAAFMLTIVCTLVSCGDETHTHAYGNWETTKEATCTESGEEARYCSCGDVQTRNTSKSSHTYSDWYVKTAATCTESSLEERACTCGDKQTRTLAANGHTYGEWSVKTEATCTEKGTEKRECACGKTEERKIDLIPHSFGDWYVKTEATCTEDGVEERKCACGETEEWEIDATGHSFGDWYVKTEATCTEDGVEERKCACGESEECAIDATGHSYGEWETKIEATCSESGAKCAACTVCGNVTTETIPATNEHSYNGGDVTKEPTCGIAGTKLFTCTICGETKSESIPATGHSMDKNGKCTVCGLVTLDMTDEEIEDSKSVSSMSYSVYSSSGKRKINISFEDSEGYTVEAPAYVDVLIIDDNGKTLYNKTVIKKSSKSSVTIDYSELELGYTNVGTLYYTVYNDYFSFDRKSHELEDLPWTVDLEVPSTPRTINYYSYSGTLNSACKITSITFRVNGDDMYIYVSGEKTYDKNGNSQSSSCYIGWKLYDEDGYVVDDGTIYTNSVAVGEKFKDATASAYDCIEQGKTYRLVLLNVN